MPRLIIVRHAAAAPADSGGDDHDRPLSDRGLAQLPGLGAAVGEHIASHPLDVVLCSSAARTRQTVEGISDHADLSNARANTMARLYLAGVDELLRIVRRLPASVDGALLCGHNPGLHELALTLLGVDGSPKRLRHGLPTAGLVVIDIDGTWRTAADSSELAAFVAPAD